MLKFTDKLAEKNPELSSEMAPYVGIKHQEDDIINVAHIILYTFCETSLKFTLIRKGF